MPAIARSALWILAAGLAPGAEPVEAVLLDLSAALEEGNAARFLAWIDRRCPNYGALEANVVALVAQYEVGSSVEAVGQSREGEAVELKLDWMLRLRPAGGGPVVERRQPVRCRLEPRGKRWKVTVLEPASFFSAVAAR